TAKDVEGLRISAADRRPLCRDGCRPGRRWRWPGCAWSAADDPQGDSGGALDESAGVVEQLVDVLTVGAFGEIGVVELVAALRLAHTTGSLALGQYLQTVRTI